MRKLLSVLLTAVLCVSACAQVSDTLTLGKNNREFFIKGDQKFKFSEYKKVFTDPTALGYMKKANTNSTVSQVFAAIGGGFIGFGLTREILRNKTVYRNGIAYKEKQEGGWGIVGIGLGCVGIGIPFAISAKKNLKKAIKTQNESAVTEENKATSYKLDIRGNGISLSYNF